jgi:hypothetical protein
MIWKVPGKLQARQKWSLSNYRLLDAAGKAATAIEKRRKKTLQKGRPSVLPGPSYKSYYWFLIACPSQIPCCNCLLDITISGYSIIIGIKRFSFFILVFLVVFFGNLYHL